MNKYGKKQIGMALGAHRLFSDADSNWETSWKPSVPEATATLWHYMSFVKFCSLLVRKELFFALVGDMKDKDEGFIYPPIPREPGDRLQQAEHLGCDVLHKIARTALISCWTESGHESSLMWETYGAADGVAVRTTFRDLKESIQSVAKLPVKFGQIKYVDYRKEVSRFGWAPLFHKRMEYRGEGEVRAVLLGPPLKDEYLTNLDLDIQLDPDVAKQRGRYIPVNLEILVQEIVLPPHAAPWFAQIVKSVVHQSPVRARVTRSAIESPPHDRTFSREQRSPFGSLPGTRASGKIPEPMPH